MLRLLLIIKNLFAFFRIIVIFILCTFWILITAFMIRSAFIWITESCTLNIMLKILCTGISLIISIFFIVRKWFEFGTWIGDWYMEYSERFYPWIERKIFKVKERMIG